MTLSSLPIIDIDLGIKLAGGKESLAKEMIALLQQNLPSEKQAIEDAYTRRDFKEVVRLVHRLHGAVSYCGTPELKQVTRDLEIALREKKIARVETLYKDFIAAIDRVQSALL